MDKNLIQAEILENEFEELKELVTEEFSKIVKYTEKTEIDNEKLVSEHKIPDKETIKDVSITDLVIDLALSSVAKSTALKLQKLEKFLSKIEDHLFSEESIKQLSKNDLMNLYTQTRMMRTDAFRMLQAIRKEVDFSQLEAQLLSIQAKQDLEDGDTALDSVLNKIITSMEFEEAVMKSQLNEGEINE